MSNVTHLGALDWLGRGIDMTSLTPFDMNSVKTLIKRPRIIAIQNDTKTHEVTIDGVKYTIPRVVSASDSAVGVQSSNVTYKSGSEALQGFNSDPGATGRLAVIANVTSYPLSKSLPEGYQFAFFNLNSDVYIASVQEYVDFIDESVLLQKIGQLPKPFSTDPQVIKAYMRFFQELGSHVITNTTYGAHCNLSVWASNSYQEVNANWSRDVTASVRGINDSGQFDETVFSEPQYRIFETIAQTLFTVRGGDPTLAGPLMQGHFDFDKLKQWAISSREHPEFVSMKATELWTILRDSDNADLRNSADLIEEAFKAIVSLHQQQKVASLVILEGVAGLVEVGLLTPSAVVGVGGPLPAFDPTTQHIIGLSETKVRWGEVGTQPKNVVIPFYIVNDGTPIDLYVRRDSGQAEVTISGNTFSADVGTDSVKMFYQVPVIPQREPKN